MRQLKMIVHLSIMVFGLFLHALGVSNKVRWHGSYVYVYCNTGGRISDWMSKLISITRSQDARLDESAQGVLGFMSEERRAEYLQVLNEKGYLVFERALSEEICERLMQFACNSPAIVRPMDGESKDAPPKMALYNNDNPLAVRYDYAVNDLLANAEVQKLLADKSLLSLAQAYLKTLPHLDVLSMWWHTPYHAKADSEAAQLFHFDLDRFKWLKVFVYLTDVGPDDGPHSFIEGSHNAGAIPDSLMRRGYVRLNDEEVSANFPNKEVKFSAPRGTIIVEDTRGLHKGNAVHGNARLILQLQLSNSLFGAVYPKSNLPNNRISELDDLINQLPNVYKAYL
jgi:hypothetical protein